MYYAYPDHAEVFTRYDFPMIEQLYSFVQFEKSRLEVIVEDEKRYREKAIRLMDLIKQEYHLTNQ
jgi:hypothetical protein